MQLLTQNGISLTAKNRLHDGCWSRLLAMPTPLQLLLHLYEQVEATMGAYLPFAVGKHRHQYDHVKNSDGL
jgi:hypothetical protein